jgi:hypothetical protein
MRLHPELLDLLCGRWLRRARPRLAHWSVANSSQYSIALELFQPIEFHQIAIDSDSNEPMLTESGGLGEGREFDKH